MNPPTPIAVRAALKKVTERTPEENAVIASERRFTDEILKDHIRAVAAEMRHSAGVRESYDETIIADVLSTFANKLEGKISE